jgi:hypothetical protein
MPRELPPAPAPTLTQRLERLPFHWLLFAAYPILFLYAQNIGELEPDELVIPLLIVVGIATLGFVILTRFVDARRAAIIVSGSVILLALYGPLDENIQPFLRSWAVRAAILFGAGLLLVVVALRLRGGLGTATLALDALAVVLVAFTAIPIAQQLVSSATTTPDPGASSPITASGPGTTRDIWWIILDRYGSDRVLAAELGVPQNDLTPWLQDRGFQTLTDAHANYIRTSLSLASTLHLTHLDGLAQRMGADSGSYAPIVRWLKDHPVGRFLQSQGYRYTQVGSWFPFTRESDIADQVLRPGESRDFGTLVKNATVLTLIDRIHPEKTLKRDAAAAVSAIYQWQQLGRLCREVGQDFVFAHVLLPHPPYVFHDDGTLATEQDPSSYAEQTGYVNDRMRELVECLQDRPEADQPIIVLQADEGPYPARYGRDQDGFDWSTATPSELAMKFEILDAMYLPGLPEGVAPPASGMTAVNTFRYLLSSYFGADLPLLPDRVFTSPRQRPYDLTDVTDRLPGPDATLAPIPRPGGADAEASLEPETDPEAEGSPEP